MAQKSVWFFALLLAMGMIGCGGNHTEGRFGNPRKLPGLSGTWNFTATSQTMSQKFQGTASIAQTNYAVQGTVNLLFDYCAPTATISGVLTPTDPFDSSSLTSYSPVNLTLQENVTGGDAPQQVNLTGSASADGSQMSGTYTAPAGGCTAGDTGVWTAAKR